VPYRKEPLITDQCYHIFNRGIDGMSIFKENRDYNRFMKLLSYYNHENLDSTFSFYLQSTPPIQKKILSDLQLKNKLVEIICFCLMPNHYHLILRQSQDNGISTFLRVIQNGYAKYFNAKYKRSGPLMQSAFQVRLIDSDEKLYHVSRYIHLNPSTAYLVPIDKLQNYSMSSYPSYIGKDNMPFITTNLILSNFNTKNNYKKFVIDQADYQKELKQIKDQIIE